MQIVSRMFGTTELKLMSVRLNLYIDKVVTLPTLMQLTLLHPTRGAFMAVYVVTHLKYTSIKYQRLFLKAVFIFRRRLFGWT
jgi:hypothetical protein